MVSYNFNGISGCLSTLMFVLLSVDAKHEIVAKISKQHSSTAKYL